MLPLSALAAVNRRRECLLGYWVNPLKIGDFFIPDHERCSETGPVLVNDLQTPPLSQKEPFFVQNVAPVKNQISDFCSFEFNFLRYGRS